MISSAILRLAMREIRFNLMRSILTALGIIIGVAAVIAIVSLGRGATQKVTSDISSLGRNLLIVSPGTDRRGGMYVPARPFDNRDGEAITREMAPYGVVAPSANHAATAVYGNANWATQVIGTSNGYLGVREWPLALGRAFNEAEERSGRAVCVLGQTVRNELFGAQDPLGARIRVTKIPCTVIGVLASKGKSTFGTDQDDVIVMPIKAVQRRLTGKTDIDYVFISITDANDMTKARVSLEAMLRERRGIAVGAGDDFTVSDLEEITKVVSNTTGILTALLGAIAAVSLLVGGIGIMNIMLVSVTERTREIGIRLAIGAAERDVLLQFLTEAAVLSALGGILGVLVGLGLSALAAHFLNLPFIVDIPMMVVAVAFAGAVGIAFGFFPARRAARLDPIEALRYE